MTDPRKDWDGPGYIASLRHPVPAPTDPNWPAEGTPGHCALCRDRAESAAFAFWIGRLCMRLVWLCECGIAIPGVHVAGCPHSRPHIYFVKRTP